MDHKSSERMLELDALRGLCALGVVLFHYTTLYHILFAPHAKFLFLMPWVPYRIQLFAMLSGFVIFMIVEKTKDPKDFIVARFSRLYPSYAVAVIFVAVLMVVFPEPNHILVNWPTFFSNLSMLQAWIRYDSNMDRSFWFLAPEISFYVFVLCLMCLKKTENIEWIGLIGLVLVVVTQRYGHWGPLNIPAVLVFSRLLFFWHFFFAGILFYRLKSKGESGLRHTALALCFIVENLICDDAYTVLCFACCILLFYLFIYGKLNWIAQKPLIYLGTISYSLFLIHQNMGCVIIYYLFKIGANAWVRLLVPIAVSVMLASLLTFGVEKPVMNFIRNRCKRRPV